MYDAWTLVGVGGGSAALTWLAAGRKQGDANTLRLSFGNSNSLLGDVRFLGGGLAWLASMYTGGQTKKVMQTVAAASIFSLVQTELVRWRLRGGAAGNQTASATLAGGTLAPSYNFGALPGPSAQPQYSAPQGAWAHR